MIPRKFAPVVFVFFLSGLIKPALFGRRSRLDLNRCLRADEMGVAALHAGDPCRRLAPPRPGLLHDALTLE